MKVGVAARRLVAVGLVAGMLPACSMLKKAGSDAGDAEAEASAAPVVEAASAPLAANEGDVTRYPDEKATANSALTTESPADLRTEVGAGGKLVVILKKGTEVDKVAEHAGHYLVIAQDVKDSTRKLMGWAAESAFVLAFHRHLGDASAADGATAGGGVDGGAGPGPKPLDIKKKDGACPAGYASCGAMCRATCKADGDCGVAGAHCTVGFCMGPGAAACQ